MSDERKEGGDLKAYLETLFNKCIGKRAGTSFSESCQVCGFKSGCEKFYKVILRRIQQKPEINEAYVKEKAREIHNELYEDWVCVGGCTAMDIFEKVIRIVISDARGLQVPVVKIKAVPVKPDGNEKFPYECCEKCDRLIKQFACKGVPYAIECLYLLSKMKIKKKGGD